MKKQKLHISKKRKVFSKDRQWNETQQTYLGQFIKKNYFYVIFFINLTFICFGNFISLSISRVEISFSENT